ncbi:MAG: hypothetical protein M3R70_12985 [Actinomycetota bacterium]|nr:hypothetical protein [Actinomycetota bacterium]
MSELEFLSVDRAAPEAVAKSPLERALREADPRFELRDLSLKTGKLDVRGDLGLLDVEGDIVRLTDQRALVLCNTSEVETVRARVRQQGLFVVDMTGALAGLELRGDRLMRRLTDLDLDALPVAGPFAHVPATVLRDDGGRFRVFFPQEFGHYVAEVVLDTAEGLPEWR